MLALGWIVSEQGSFGETVICTTSKEHGGMQCSASEGGAKYPQQLLELL
jgi:hypothetical protein